MTRRTLYEVPTIAAPSAQEFRRDFFRPGRPAILEGLMDSWPATRSWNPEYFKQRIGDKQVMVQVAPDGVFGLDPEKGGPRYSPRLMAVRDYVDAMQTAASGGDRYYIQRLSIPHAAPELLSDFSTPPYVKPNRVYLTNLWFGPGGNVTRLHYDVPSNFFAQVYGHKRFIIFPPGETRKLYPYRTKAYNMSQVNIERPDLSTFPRYGSARHLEFVIGPGQMLFLPSFWWHQVYSEDTGISINFWSIPALYHLVAPQTPDSLWDTVKESWRFFRQHSGSPLAGEPASNGKGNARP
ncbi:MAG TPA: cupin-like domain-containing protein [Chloroflexota bacterium]